MRFDGTSSVEMDQVNVMWKKRTDIDICLGKHFQDSSFREHALNEAERLGNDNDERIVDIQLEHRLRFKPCLNMSK